MSNILVGAELLLVILVLIVLSVIAVTLLIILVSLSKYFISSTPMRSEPKRADNPKKNIQTNDEVARLNQLRRNMANYTGDIIEK